MANDSYSVRLTELARVIRHLCNMQRLRAEAQRLGQRPETLDALDSVIALDAARAEELNELLESRPRHTSTMDGIPGSSPAAR
ncbi:hypothetical protein ACPWT1_12430 [Ramlibacter sp. MMS24-I3-19]|uniref:hypothetical protein n=1 Tax=Ramlibacter sp. MMS24-I3-19 TaxID=3416606 RepID=UPI003D04FBC3